MSACGPSSQRRPMPRNSLRIASPACLAMAGSLSAPMPSGCGHIEINCTRLELPTPPVFEAAPIAIAPVVPSMFIEKPCAGSAVATKGMPSGCDSLSSWRLFM